MSGEPTVRTYRTRGVEPLWYISLRVHGTASRWRELAEANEGTLAAHGVEVDGDTAPNTMVPADCTLVVP